MKKIKLNYIQLVLISLSIGFLSHHLFILIPQQESLIQSLNSFIPQFSTLYKAQQLNILKILTVPWLIEGLTCILLIKKKINKLNHYLSLANIGLLLLGLISLGVDFTLQLMLFNGYHVFAYNTSNILHWGLLNIWIIRLIIVFIQIKTCKNNN